MKSHPEIIGEKVELLGLYNNVSSEDLEAARLQALKYLSSAVIESVDEELRDGTPVRPRRISSWSSRAAMAVIAAAIVVAVLMPALMRSSAPAVLEGIEGLRKIEFNTIVSSEGSGSTLQLADGSRVEMRAQSQLSFEPADDGIRIRLSKGDVIVTAARQASGRHLHVQTKEVTVSVVGTVFLVKAEVEGSRVGVIQGEVQVEQDGASKELRPGEQIMTKPSMVWRPVSEEISWSRHVEKHLALLQKSAIPSGAARPAEPRAVFEVASIRRSPPPAPGVIPVDGPSCHGVAGFEQVDPRRFTASGITLFTLVMSAYGTDCVQIDGGPEWIRSEEFIVQALIPEGSPVYTQQDLLRGNAPVLQDMIQNLLADRFKLAVHREMKEMPHYDLVVVKEGKLKLSEDQSLPYAPAPLPLSRLRGADYAMPRGTMALKKTPSGETILELKALPVSELAKNLQSRLAAGRIVVDKTDLKGLFDIRLQFGPETSLSAVSDPTSVPLLTAIQEQLGLKLESTKAPVEVLVIDRVEKPSDN